MLKNGLPIIDYQKHPYIKNYAPLYSEQNNSFVDQQLNALNLAFKEIKANPTYLSSNDIESFFKNKVDQIWQTIITQAKNEIRASEEVVNVLNELIQETNNKLKGELHYFNESKKDGPYQVKKNHPQKTQAQSVYEELKNQGAYIASMSSKDQQFIFNDLKPYREILLKKRKNLPQDRCHIPIPMLGAYWKRIEKYLHELAFAEGGSLYHQKPLIPYYCALVLSHPEESWYKDCFKNFDLPTSKTAYMHYDEDYDFIKFLLYLDDVENEHGPFSFVPNAGEIEELHTQFYIQKSLDNVLEKKYSLPQSQVKYYYRSRYFNPEFTKVFSSLPKAFQGSSHFGDDIMDDTLLSKELLQKEKILTSDVGNFFIFRGGSTIHRGGLVKRGERWALQMALHKRPPIMQHSLHQSSQKIKFYSKKIIGQKNFDRLKQLIK